MDTEKLLKAAKLLHKLGKERIQEAKAIRKLGDLEGAMALLSEADLLFDANQLVFAKLDAEMNHEG